MRKFKYFGFFLIGLVLILLYFFVNPSETNYYPKCPLYVTTGIYCPGCGSQRATYELLHFHFLGVLKQNLLYILGIFILVYHLIVSLLNTVFNKKIYNYLYHPKTPWILLIIILVFWVLRNLPYYPFNLLAPH